jgi:hypothetical protein
MQITSNPATVGANPLSGSAANQKTNPTATDQDIGFEALFRNVTSLAPEAPTTQIPSGETGFRALFGHPEPPDAAATKSGPDIGFEALFRNPDTPEPVNTAGQGEGTKPTGFAALFSSPELNVSANVEDSLLSA